jgi:hypothetical protein
LRIKDNVILRKIQIHFFAVNLHFLLGKGSLQPVGDAFVVGAKGYAEAAVHLKVNFVVVVANLCEFLAHDRLKDFIVAAFFRMENLRRVFTKCLVVHVDGKGAVLEYRSAVQDHVVAQTLSGADAHFDALVGRL